MTGLGRRRGKNKDRLFVKESFFLTASLFCVFWRVLRDLVVKGFAANFFVFHNKLTAQGACGINPASFVELCDEKPLHMRNPTVYNDLMKGKKAALAQIVPVHANL